MTIDKIYNDDCMERLWENQVGKRTINFIPKKVRNCFGY